MGTVVFGHGWARPELAKWLAAAGAGAIDRTAEECTRRAAQKRTDGTVTASGHFVTEQRAYASTNQQTRGAIVGRQ